MKNGWIKLHRQIQEKGYYKKSKYVHLWIHILLKANHKPSEFMWNNEIIIIKEGQFITGRKQLAEETGINENSIERILKMLEKEHQIEQQKTTKFRLISVINWKEYQEKKQQNEQQVNNKETTSEQQVNTNNNNKNIKNDKNNIINKSKIRKNEDIVYEKIDKPLVNKKNKYGNPSINELIQYLKDQIDGELDNTIANNRYMVKHLIGKFEKHNKKNNLNKDPVEQIKYLIKHGRQDKFHSSKITNFGYIYRNSITIMNAIKNKVDKKEKKIIKLR